MGSSVMWLYLMRIFCAFATALYSSLPNWARCAAPELHCFLGKTPQASIREIRRVGACRLKYLQWRHAVASFIRCLSSRTIKLSTLLDQSQIMLFSFWHCCINFSFFPGLQYVSIWNTLAVLEFVTLLKWKLHLIQYCLRQRELKKM